MPKRKTAPTKVSRKTTTRPRRTLKHSTVVKQLEAVHGDAVLLLDKYKGLDYRYRFQCTGCTNIWSTFMGGVKRGSGCPKCARLEQSKIRQSTQAEYEARVKEKHGTNIKLMGQYRGSRVPHRFKCYTCLSTWKTQARTVVDGRGCPKCQYAAQSERVKLSDKECVARAKKYKVALIDKPNGAKGDQRFRCLKCKHEWLGCAQKVLLGKTGCPECGKVSALRKNSKFKVKEIEIDGQLLRLQGYEPQAVQWLLKYRPHLSIADIKTDASGEVPVVSYKVGRRNRKYFPDLFIAKQNRLLEVKSAYTLGVLNGRGWYKNQMKARACIAQGYKFTMLVMDGKGLRFKLPKEWYKMSRHEVNAWVAHRRGEKNNRGFM